MGWDGGWRGPVSMPEMGMGSRASSQLAAGQGIGSVASPGAPQLEEFLQLQTWGLEEPLQLQTWRLEAPLQLQTWRYEAAVLPQLPARRTRARCLVEEKPI